MDRLVLDDSSVFDLVEATIPIDPPILAPLRPGPVYPVPPEAGEQPDHTWRARHLAQED